MYEYHAIPPYQYSYEYQVMVAPARDACTRSKAGASAESRLTNQHNYFTSIFPLPPRRSRYTVCESKPPRAKLERLDEGSQASENVRTRRSVWGPIHITKTSEESRGFHKTVKAALEGMEYLQLGWLMLDLFDTQEDSGISF
jgi:hypothetical protein